MSATYTETTITHALARNTFRDSLCVVDRCQWPGSECDLLVVTRNLRVVDVEVKISRADLKQDREKDKWYNWPSQAWRPGAPADRVLRAWPKGVWKHYYAVAAPIWREDLLQFCAPYSGVLVVEATKSNSPRHWRIRCVKRAKPCRDAKPLTPAQAIDIARLASLRMWDAYGAVDRIRDDSAHTHAVTAEAS